MKKIIIVICFLCSCLFSDAQNCNQLNDIINESLLLFLDWHTDIIKGSVNGYEKNLHYICGEGLPYGTIPSDSVRNYDEVAFASVQYPFTQKGLKKGKKYPFVFISIQIVDKQIRIMPIVKNATVHKDNHLDFESSDYAIYVYEYSCENQEWKLNDVKYSR